MPIVRIVKEAEKSEEIDLVLHKEDSFDLIVLLIDLVVNVLIMDLD